ncbi:MAG: hypothetical protein ACTSR8_21780 [Promethearchaeota archaeon]
MTSQAWFKNAIGEYIWRKRLIKQCWDRINNINKHITDLVAHNIVEIAAFYKIPLVAFEDLK